MPGTSFSPDKIKVFWDLFVGLDSAYGTVNPVTGKHRIVKSPVTERVIADHLAGKNLFATFLLEKDKTKAVVVDFDTGNKIDPFEFYSAVNWFGLPAYIEISRQKGFHVWCFFENPVPAVIARRAFRGILQKIGRSEGIEIFPKQDCLDDDRRYGNTINTPLFGALVCKNKTVFVNPRSFEAYEDQWGLLSSIKKVDEGMLLEVIANTTDFASQPVASVDVDAANIKYDSFSLLPCIQKMLHCGVSRLQKSSCFWLAVHLKKIGLPQDLAVVVLEEWSKKNSPQDGKGVMSGSGIPFQAECAYSKNYKGLGCSTDVLSAFCDDRCRVKAWRKKQRN